MTTLEKLCRAACEANGVSPDAVIGVGLPRWVAYRDMMKAILTALEDPSDEMVKAGVEYVDDPEDPQTFGFGEARGVFTAMIRKAKG